MFQIRMPTQEAGGDSGIPEVDIQAGQRLEMEIWKLSMATEYPHSQESLWAFAYLVPLCLPLGRQNPVQGLGQKPPDYQNQAAALSSLAECKKVASSVLTPVTVERCTQ